MATEKRMFPRASEHEADLENFYFKLGLTITLEKDGEPKIEPGPEYNDRDRQVVYVAVMDNGVVLKTGITDKSLKARWKDTLKVVRKAPEKENKRPHEQSQGECLHALMFGRVTRVWYKIAEEIHISYFGGHKFPAHGAEEYFVDWHFEPVFGNAISERLGISRRNGENSPRIRCRSSRSKNT